MGSTFQNGFADKANLHQVAGTYSNPPKTAKSGRLKCPPVRVFIQGIKLIQSPYMAFQFSNLVQQVSEKNVGVGNEGIKKQRRGPILLKSLLCARPCTAFTLAHSVLPNIQNKFA